MKQHACVSEGVTARIKAVNRPIACFRSLRLGLRRPILCKRLVQCQSSIQTGSSAPALEARGIEVAFGTGAAKKQVLKGADLTVPAGTFHILLGPNGCGKSTLLRVLGGLLPADGGVYFVQRPVGFVFQNPDHQVVMPTVAADVAFGLGRYDLGEEAVRTAVERALGQVNLLEFMYRPTHTLSGGQKQRVAIAGALAENPKVLLLDELTTYLDDEDQQSVLKAVRGLVGGPDQITAVWVTHRLEELEFADGASYMDKGKVQVTGSAEKVAAHMRSLGAKV